MFQIKNLRSIKISNFLLNNTIICHNSNKINRLGKKNMKNKNLKYNFILSFNLFSLIHFLPNFNYFFENKILTFSTLFFSFTTFYLFYKLNNFEIDYTKLDYTKLDYTKLDYNLIDYTKFSTLFSNFDIKTILITKGAFYLQYKKLIQILKKELFETNVWFDLNFRAYENSLNPEGLFIFKRFSEEQQNFNVLKECDFYQEKLLLELNLSDSLTKLEDLVDQKSIKIVESLILYDQGILLKNSDQILQLLENLSL